MLLPAPLGQNPSLPSPPLGLDNVAYLPPGDIRRYGARNYTSASVNTRAILRALDDVGIVNIPSAPAPFLVNAFIAVPNNAEIIGNGYGSAIQREGATDALVFYLGTSARASLRNLRVMGPANGAGGASPADSTPVVLEAATDCEVCDVWIDNGYFAGLAIYQATRCSVRHVTINGSISVTSSDVYIERGVQDWLRLQDIRCLSPGKQVGIIASVVGANDINGLLLEDVLVDTTNTNIGHAIALYAQALSTGVFRNPRLVRCRTRNSSQMGLYAQGGAQQIIGLVIDGCEVDEFVTIPTGGTLLDAGIGLTGTVNSKIVNTNVRKTAAGSSGISAIRAANSPGVSVTTCGVQTTVQMSRAIWLDVDSPRASATDCVVDGPGANLGVGISLDGNDGTAIGNRVRAANTCIQVQGNRNYVDGNHTENGVVYGTRVQAGDNNRIGVNPDNGSAFPFDNAGTNTRVTVTAPA